MDSLLVVRGGRDPFEVMFLIACVLAGISGLIFGASSPNLAVALPGDTQTYWFAGVLVGSVLGLVGAFSKPPTGLVIERVGLALLSGLCGAYGVSIILNSANGALVGMFVTLAFGVASLIRVWQIGVDLRVLKEQLAKIKEEDEAP